MTVVVKKLLLDVLKPRELSIFNLSRALCKVEGVSDVEIIVSEVDTNTETIKITVNGPKIKYAGISQVMEKQGASLRGVDEIMVTKVRSVESI